VQTNLDAGVVLCDKWRVVRLPRQNETSQAYLADHCNGGQVVLRVLHERLCRDEVTAARFRREAYIANALVHPAIIQVLDVDVLPDGRTVLATEPVDGQSLAEICIAFGGRLPLEMALGLLVQLLDLLAGLHAEGIVHRNLRPDVVLVNQGQVKIADFGFARFVDSSEELTQTGFVLGTPAFRAPEQTCGERELVDAQSDIFAVGAIAFLLLSGQTVHPSDSLGGYLDSVSRSSARSLRTVVKEGMVPDELVHAIDKALAFRKSERWLFADDFARALRQVLDARAMSPLWICNAEDQPSVYAAALNTLFEDDERTVPMSDEDLARLHRALVRDEPANDADSSLLPPKILGAGTTSREADLGVYSAVLLPREDPPNTSPGSPAETEVEPQRTSRIAGHAARILMLGALLLLVLSALLFVWPFPTRAPHGAKGPSATARVKSPRP
jgi:serine/threonine protein kinase